MNSRYKYMQCRLCLCKSGNLCDIYQCNGELGFTAADIISDLLQFKVSKTDEYPQLVCLECFCKLINFKNFKKNCQNAKSKFEMEISNRIVLYARKTEKSETGKMIEQIIPFCFEVKELEVISSNSNSGNSSAISYQFDSVRQTEKKVFQCCKCHAKFCQKQNFDAHMKVHEEEDFCCNLESKIEASQLSGTRRQEKVIFECRKCQAKFCQKQNFDAHMKEHNEEKVTLLQFDSTEAATQDDKSNHQEMTLFECSKCHQKYCQKQTFDAHMMRHKEEEDFTCEFDSKKEAAQLADAELQEKQVNEHGSGDCQEVSCGKQNLDACMMEDVEEKYIPSTEEKTHDKGDVSAEEQIIPCDAKSENFEEENKISLVAENSSASPKSFSLPPFCLPVGQCVKEVYECGECGERFWQKRKLNSHMKGHMEEKRFPCKVCGKKFKYNWSVAVHMRIHSGEKPYRCKFCEMSFNQSSSYKKHVLRKHTEKQFQCELCSQKFIKSQTLLSHMKIHKQFRLYGCDECEKRFGTAEMLEKHTLLHARGVPFECDACRKMFDHKLKLARHVKSHSEEKPYTCNVCDKRFFIRSHLGMHMTLHTGERNFGCEECGKNFRKKRNLVLHKRVHSGERPYQCSFCEKRFSQRGSLTGHMRLHSSR